MRLLEVLLIEDNPADVRLLREGLSRSRPSFGINVSIAENGEQALEMLRYRPAPNQPSESYRPDMILLDLGLSRIDGETVPHRIRSFGIDLATVPVIAFSSSQPGIQEVLDSGASAYIVKPIGLLEYLKAIERFAILWLKPHADAA